jgi:glycosyltransferase involved in cell wall biosynthesis
MTDLVSVIIPAYNHEAYIDEAVTSVLSQTYSNIEIIVVDDGSRDGTAERVRSLANVHPQKIRLLCQENAGAHEAINVGLAQSRGDWLTILNSDDSYAPRRLEKLLLACKKEQRNWGFSRLKLIRERGVPIDAGGQIVIDVQKTISHWPTIGFAFLQNNVAGSSGNLFFARKLWISVGRFAPLQYLHDWNYALRLLLHEEPVLVDEALYSYRLHSDNSYRLLGEVVGRESSYVMRSFFLEAILGRPSNALLPTPENWPGFFEKVIELIKYYQYLPSWSEGCFANQTTREDRHYQ